MNIDWAALGLVSTVTLIGTVGFVTIMSLAATCLDNAVVREADGLAIGHLRLAANLLFGLVGLCVLFGLYLIIPWLH